MGRFFIVQWCEPILLSIVTTFFPGARIDREACMGEAVIIDYLIRKVIPNKDVSFYIYLICYNLRK